MGILTYEYSEVVSLLPKISNHISIESIMYFFFSRN